MRYGMNPHQIARVVGDGPRVLNGDPSMINYLDALNAFALVRELDAATGLPSAASFKHVSPAGAAVAGRVDDVAAETWRVGDIDPGSLLSAYVRARDADPKSSFGDVVALSRPVDRETAEFLSTVISDALIAPGYEPGAAEILSRKRGGRFLIFEADAEQVPPAIERREVMGVTLEQDRDVADISAALPASLSGTKRTDALVGLATVRYTQSNSVAFVGDGAAIGIGAGQQNRVDCVRLAGGKARIWHLRRHPFARSLTAPARMTRQDLLNWQIRFAGREMTRSQLVEFTRVFGSLAAERYADPSWREGRSDALTMVSDGFLPFRDNVEHAAEFGVGTIVEPGGSARADEVSEAAREAGIMHVQTGLRLFRH